MNYRDLLKRYIALVEDCEGVNFIDGGYDVTLTDEERAALNELADEVHAEGGDIATT
jgi:hypothetical protein